MDINELESYRLADAVKFHNQLNPRLWGNDEHLRPEVKSKLLAIAEDFCEFLGITGLEIKDITVSGSNAAYTYTNHSDIDLHVVVDMPESKTSDIYQELFDAKKYQYNDQHDFKIGGYDVELYVQNANEPHHSQGIYSLINNDWVRVPSRKQPSIDDMSVRNKYEDIGHRIDAAINSGSTEQLENIATKVRTMRQSGLDKTGEFGPENLAFKVLRNNGTLDRLRQARLAAKDREMSLEAQHKTQQRKKYGQFGGLQFTDTVTVDETAAADQPSEPQDIKQILRPFVKSCVEYLGIQKPPRIILKRDPEWTRRNGTFGRFDPDTQSVTLAVSNRHVLDILRTLAHELTHARQNELAAMPADAGATGSPHEDEANAMAGRIMRHWVDHHPDFFKDIRLEEGWKERLAGVAAAACVAGTPGCATTQGATVGDALRGVQAVGRAANTVKQTGVAGARELAIQRAKDELRRQQGQVVPEDYDPDHPPGPETKPTMPAGTVRVDVSDVYDWYKLGQAISNLPHADKNQFGKGPPSTIVSFGSEPEEHKYIKDLEKLGLTTTDVDPVDVNQPPDMPRQKTDPTYNVNEAFDQPYPLKWEKSTYGDYDALARLDDGTYLSIMFNNEFKKNWMVEFHRNNSQAVTGEGDAQRIFATVLTAIQQFVKKKKPQSLFFSAVKEDDPTGSRTKLYDRLVQRYAGNLGYSIQRQESPGSMSYKLIRTMPVTEATGYVPVNSKEAQDPRYIMAITQDIQPGEIQRQARKMGFRTTAAGIPPTLKASGKL